MSDKIYFVYDEDGNIAGVGDATDMAAVQRQFFLDMIDLIGDERPSFEDVQPHLMAMPNDMVRPVVAVTTAQLLTIIRQNYEFFEANGVDSKAAMRKRWRDLIEGLDGGDDD